MANSSDGSMPSRDRNPCMWAAGALRGSPASITATALRARPSTSAALSPAAPPPTSTTSYRCSSMIDHLLRQYPTRVLPGAVARHLLRISADRRDDRLTEVVGAARRALHGTQE